MSSKKRKKKQRPKRYPVSSRKEKKQKTEKGEKKSVLKMVTGWFSRHPVFLFLLIFGVLMGLFYAFVIFTPFYKKYFLISYLPFNAKVSGAVLSFLDQDITVADTSISSPDFSIRVASECNGIEPIALFVCAVLAFPVPFLRKIPGIIAGSLLLAILNFVRIISLFLIGVYFPSVFLTMHIEVWQALFIFFAIFFWILWLRWATRRQISTQAVSD